MKTNAHNGLAHQLGLLAGGVCRWLLRCERRAATFLIEWGASNGIVEALAWVVRLLAVGALLYVASWLLIVFLALVGLWWLGDSPAEETEWPIGDQAEHKKSLFYDPIDYDDDPDPRFNDF